VNATTEPQPRGPAWRRLPVPEDLRYDRRRLAQSVWSDGRVLVISSLIDAELPDGSGVGLQWHVSVSQHGKRPKPRELDRARRAFGIVGWEEDNHHPGNARHYFRPVDPSKRVDCECKANETVVVERDGYRWTNPTDEPCRGCELEKLLGDRGKPCPLHPKE
jgi:hypothetical protein